MHTTYADTQFNHANIIKYCNRPFKNTYVMNNYIIEKWSSIIEKTGTVYHLGDLGFGKSEKLKTIHKLKIFPIIKIV